MSDADYWAAARAPRWPHSRYMSLPQTAPPEPEPDEVSVIPDISAMDQATYAANRDSIMGGVKPASEFRGVDMPRGSTALTDEQVAALMPWRHLGTPPPAGRVLDSEYSKAAHYAAGHASLAVPNRFERD